MKKVSITLAGVLLFFGVAFAQLNPGLETWSGTSPDINPDHWLSNNQFTAILGVDGLFVSQDADASEGSSSARLVTKTCPNCPANNLPNPAPGFMEQAEPFSGTVLDSVKFDYKYIPAAVTDTAYFQIKFTHWNGTGAPRTHYANHTIDPSTTWKTASSPIIPDIDLAPDSLILQFFTSLGSVAGIGTDTDGSALLVDNIRFISIISGVEESLEDIMSIRVYPNPTVDHIVFETDRKDVQRVDFLDVTGKIVQSELLSAGRTEIGLGDRLAGNYIYVVYAEDGRQMKSGKVLVGNK